MENYKEINYELNGDIGKIKIEKDITNEKEIKKICMEDYFEKLINKINISEVNIETAKIHYTTIISKILEKSVIISNLTKADAFVNYYGHVNSFSVRIYENGWSNNNNPDYSESIYIDNSDEAITMKRLTEILEKLETLLN